MPLQIEGSQATDIAQALHILAVIPHEPDNGFCTQHSISQLNTLSAIVHLTQAVDTRREVSPHLTCGSNQQGRQEE